MSQYLDDALASLQTLSQPQPFPAVATPARRSDDEDERRRRRWSDTPLGRALGAQPSTDRSNGIDWSGMAGKVGGLFGLGRRTGGA